MPDVGADVESICGKCGDVWHVVVAKVGDKIAKVQCKQCGALHRHRPPGGAAIVTPRRTKATRGASTSTRTKTKGVPSSKEPLVEANMKRPVRKYGMSETFKVGDRITHPRFGDGVVELIAGQRKIQVFFADGRKVLAHDHDS